MKKKQLVLFDFDGTITTKDTLIEFIIFYHGYFRFLLGFTLLSPILILFKAKLIKNSIAKEQVLKYFFKRASLEQFNQKCIQFAKNKIPPLVRPNALEALKRYRDNGAQVVVVSASPENWVKVWCYENGVECISTRLKITDQLLTGEILGENCYGPEKVRRVKSQFEIHEYEIVAFGDSRGDKEMLEIAHLPHYKHF